MSDKATEAEIETARDQYGSDEIEIDDGAAVSRPDPGSGDDGLWVAAWVWVYNSDVMARTPHTYDCDDPATCDACDICGMPPEHVSHR